MPGATYDPPDAKLRRVQDIVERVEALPGVRGGVRVELRAAQRRRRRRRGRHRRPARGAGRAGADHVHRRHAALSEDAGRAAPARPRLHRRRRSSRTIRSRSSAQAMAKRFWPDGDALGGRFRRRRDGRDRRRGSRSSASRATCGSTASNPQNDQPTPVGVRAVCVSADAQHRPDDSRGRGARVDHQRGARGAPRRRSEPADVQRPDDGRRAPAELLAVRSLRLDLRRRSASSACCSRRSASTACCRIRSRSGRRRSACAWRSARAARRCWR